MKLIDADKLHIPSEEMISAMVIANAPTVNAIPTSVIEDIKAEIKERIEMWGTDGDEYHDCLDIIDKHIKG